MAGLWLETADTTCTVQMKCLTRGTGQSESDTWRALLTSVTQDARGPAAGGQRTAHDGDSDVLGVGLWSGKRDQTAQVQLGSQPEAADALATGNDGLDSTDVVCKEMNKVSS